MTIKTDRLVDEAGTGSPDFPNGMPTVDGVPIVESGSNSDGSWTRWADGTQLCFGVATFGSINFDVGVGNSTYRNQTTDMAITLPVSFFGGIDDYSGEAHVGGTGFQSDAGGVVGLQQLEHESVSEMRMVCTRTSSGTISLSVSWSAHGRWK